MANPQTFDNLKNIFRDVQRDLAGMKSRSKVAKSGIVLIDDDLVTRLAVTKLLETRYQISAFESWSKAFGVLNSEDIQLVLLDINMPGFRGDQIASMLQNSRSQRATQYKIVLYSSLPEEELEQLVASSGADGYIKKSSLPQALLFEVKKYL